MNISNWTDPKTGLKYYITQEQARKYEYLIRSSVKKVPAYLVIGMVHVITLYSGIALIIISIFLNGIAGLLTDYTVQGVVATSLISYAIINIWARSIAKKIEPLIEELKKDFIEIKD